MRRFGFRTGRDARRAGSAVAPPPTPTPTPAATTSVILAILAGQSNMEGRVAREAQDVDVERAWQLVGHSGSPSYRTIVGDVTPLLHRGGYTDISAPADRLGPGEYLARRLLADHPDADVVLVPAAKGSEPMATPGAPWFPAASGGGASFENMAAQANLAYAAAQDAFPGRPITVLFFFVQGEQDAVNGVSQATYAASLAAFVAQARARVTGAADAPFVIGSMVPEKWLPGDPNRDPAYALINRAHVDASLSIAGVRYAMGPPYTTGARDYLHYQPAQRVREQGLSLGAALSDAGGPTVTGAATFGHTAGQPLALPLAASDGHQTFHIAGGEDADLFEISDAYLAPTLRWADDGAGPAVGAYRVEVHARDGAGNFGPARSITVDVAAAGQVSPASFFTAGERGAVWDLTDLASLSQTIDGAVPVTAPGQPVGRVLDQGPNAAHWTAAADNASRPTYQIDAEGKPFLSYDGGDVLFGPPFHDAAGGRFTSCLGVLAAARTSNVLQAAGAGSAQVQALTNLATSGVGTALMRHDGAGGAGTAPSLPGVFDGATKRAITTVFAGGNVANGWRMRDAAARGTAGDQYGSSQSPGTLTAGFATSRAGLGASGGTTPGNFYAGRLYSGFAIGRACTAAEIMAGEDWVAVRMGIVLP